MQLCLMSKEKQNAYSSENITITFAIIIAITIEKIKYFSVNLWLVFSSEDKGC